MSGVSTKPEPVPGVQEKPFPGAVDHDGRVTFTLYAPGKEIVHLIGDFNEWDVHADPMRDLGDGYWSVEKNLIGGSYSYQFVVDRTTVICDAYAREVEEQPHAGPPKAVVRVRQEPYIWRHDDWRRHNFEDLAIYEMHIADFTPERSFRGATKRLDYVRDLGMNAIELMPIFEVYADTGWGYTPRFLFSVNRNYGPPNELRALIDDAHANGIAVILDVVLAHTGTEHPFNVMYPYDRSPWYGTGPEHHNEFGLPTFDYAKPATQKFVRDVLHYWLRDFHVDGFRFDFLKVIGFKDGNGTPTLVKAAREVRPDAYLIGEDVPERPDELSNSGLDGAWHARFSYALKALLCRKELYNYKYEDFPHAISTLRPDDQGYSRASLMINYLESHDEKRLMLDLKEAGIEGDDARRQSALGACILFTTAGEPMLYHGQEWGEDTEKDMDHNFIGWETLESEAGRGLQEHYKRLVTLRHEHPALRSQNFWLDKICDKEKCVIYHRWDNRGDDVVVVANFSPDKQKLEVPFPVSGRWRELFSGQELHIHSNMGIELEPSSAKIFIR